MALTLEDFLAAEEIKNVRYAYAAHLDAQNIDAMVGLFAEDAMCDFGEEWGVWKGRDAIRTNYLAVMGQIGSPFDALHCFTNPWITITSSTTAHGRWYLIDLLTRQKPVTELATRGGHENPLLYLGIYEDDYVKVDGSWKFAYCKLHFLWPERTHTELRHPDQARR